MNLVRQQKDFAKKLARLSLGSDGQIDGERAQAGMESLRPLKPRVQRALLKAYLHYLRIEDRRARMLYEYAGLIDPSELERLRTHYSQKYGRNLRVDLKPNPALLAGLRLSIGDDIYENSASGRLAALASALA
jgi:F-type H+-transporting ATPase subunit delta